jgi:hypothetical protein
MLYVPVLLALMVTAAALGSRWPRWSFVAAALMSCVSVGAMATAVVTGNLLLAYLGGVATIIGWVLVIALLRDVALDQPICSRSHQAPSA